MEKIYTNGTILTMDEDKIVEAVLVVDDKIKACGSLSYVQSLAKKKALIHDLKGACMLPAFIDSHSHISQLATILRTCDLSEASNFEEMKSMLKEFMNQHDLKDSDWLIGFGYDHNTFDELIHPNADILDEVNKDLAILITHTSGHMGVMNHKAMELVGLNPHTKDIDGGHYGRTHDGLLNGYLEEVAFMQAAMKSKRPSIDEVLSLLIEAQNIYASNGIVIAQEGILKDAEFELLQLADQQGKLFLDVIGYVDIKDHSNKMSEYQETIKDSEYFHINGYKLFLDGSPQGKTAWLSKPYEDSGSERGYPIYEDQQVSNYVQEAIDKGYQLLTHCNGDAAADQLLKAFEQAKNYDESLRPVMIHAQLIRKDQVLKMKELGMIASFFNAHTYYWGYTHLKNLGERAYHISPMNTALKEELLFTLHQDTPVVKPNMMHSIWCAVNRKTKSGITLGSNECIDVIEAIKSVTINAAYSYHLEDTNGSISENKFADFVVLEENPCICDRMHLCDIKILETIKKGKTIYKRHK